MYARGRSLEAEIDRLAAKTGAPGEFVRQVRALFSTRGIPLNADSAPYLAVLERVFLREQQIRMQAALARDRLAKIQKHLVNLNKNVERQIGKMKEVRSSIENRKPASLPRPRHRIVRPRVWTSAKSPRFSGRGLIVPGPKDLQ